MKFAAGILLKTLSLFFTEKSDKILLETAGITVFVGPNNSGKSLLLREIDSATRQPHKIQSKIVADFEPAFPDEAEFSVLLEKLTRNSPRSTDPNNVIIGKFQHSGDREQIELPTLLLRHQIHIREKHWVTSQFLRFGLTHLDGQSRLNMVQQKSMGNLQELPQNHLTLLFQDNVLREEVQAQILASIGMHFVLDPTNGGVLQIRFSNEPMDETLERSLDNSAIEFHRKAVSIADASDGIKAFTGIYLAVKCGESSTVLIDEPEAFLHPPLARKLGTILARAVADGSKSLLVATHSPDFLLGCLQASEKVQVVRLEYSQGKSNCYVVDPARLREFYANPLIRSANVLAGLFHDGVVVTESDNDRAFYNEIYFRLSEADKNLPSLLFVNTQGKDTIHQIVTVLRSFGVPTVAIPDLDILSIGGKNFSNWQNCANIPDHTQFGLGQTRASLHEAALKQSVNIKISGVDGFQAKDKEAANDLLDTLEKYGIFATRAGELENWLKHLGVAGKKTDWTVGMLKALGSDPLSDEYVRPAADDVWEHLQRVVAWVRNPARQGMN